MGNSNSNSNNSSNERENVQRGARGSSAITIRRQTDYPANSKGVWSGNVYRILAGNGKVMYESSSFPENIKSQLGTPSTTINGKVATVEFDRVPTEETTQEPKKDKFKLIDYFPN